MQRKSVNLTTVVLSAFCAVVFTTIAISDIVRRTYDSSAHWYMLKILIAVLWIGLFIVNLKRYRSSKDK